MKNEKIIVLDDSHIMKLAWQSKLKNSELHFFMCPEELISEVKKNESFLIDFPVIVLDQVFDNSPMTGTDLATIIKDEHNYTGHILLCSNGEFGENLPSSINKTIEKRAYSYNEISEVLKHLKNDG